MLTAPPMFYTSMTMAAAPTPWIFGYGSLIWRPGFAFETRVMGTLRGWTRRFWQGSSDHRGTELSPGRVVTVVQEPTEVCVGALFRVAEDQRDAILQALDVREQNGYERMRVTVVPRDGKGPIEAVTYIADPGNPHFLGPDSDAAVAAQIAAARGPSGPNLEYFLELRDRLAKLGIVEPHLEAIMQALSIQRSGDDHA